MDNTRASEVKVLEDGLNILYPEVTIDNYEILENPDAQTEGAYTKLLHIFGTVKNADFIYIDVLNKTTEERNKANGTNDICKSWYEEPDADMKTGKWEHTRKIQAGCEYKLAACALIKDSKPKTITVPKDESCFCKKFTVELFDKIFSKNTIFGAKNMQKREGIYQMDKQKLIDAINKTANRYEISNCLRLAHFLGQIGHESDNFNTTEEYASGSAYNGRKDLGNTQTGDGERYKGRGLIQLTGRNNYEKYTKYIQSQFGETVDFIKTPDIIASNINYAVDVAGWYWSVARNINILADKDDIIAVTKAINGGTNGLQDRTNKTNKAKEILKYKDCKAS